MILGVESSCDESALALFDPNKGLVGEWIDSQIAKHQPFGGIVPDIASREHLDNFPILWDIVRATKEGSAIGSIAVTHGPGLAGCLALGMSFSRALALSRDLPLVGVNHLRGHVFSPFIGLHAESPERFQEHFEKLLPHLGLIVSGGNTLLVEVTKELEVKVLMETLDDAAGEALDKGAKLMGMPYPGGPRIEELGRDGNRKAFDFPRSFGKDSKPAFSFSGLKTSLRYRIQDMTDGDFQRNLADLCASYEEAVVDALILKSKQCLQSGSWQSIGLSGGVSNNGRLRVCFGQLGADYSLPVLLADRRHTGDNAAMIAFTAWVDADHTVHDSAEKPIPMVPGLRIG